MVCPFFTKLRQKIGTTKRLQVSLHIDLEVLSDRLCVLPVQNLLTWAILEGAELVNQRVVRHVLFLTEHDLGVTSLQESLDLVNCSDLDFLPPSLYLV